ncbi:MAG: endo-1,4-beta-xylanase, partial [Melioribacteraceae bacterium]|nr:endo-1,4-beta-xylanase [Melioribacteraceae bacterium]
MMKIKYTLIQISLIIFTTLAFAQSDPGKENLTHSWTFDDGNAVDTVGGVKGVLKGAAKILNGALQTTTIDSWMELPGDTLAINKYDEITIELWFRAVPNANTGFNMIAAFGNTQNTIGVNYFFITPTRGDDVSRAAISCGDASTPWASETGSNGTEYDDGNTHQMISTIDSASITLYIDGQLQSTTPLDSNNRISEISTTYAYLAKSVYEADPTWRGEIFEFNIYDKALSADGILSLYDKANFGAGDKPVAVEAEDGELGSLFTTMEDGDISYITTTASYSGAASPGDSTRVATYEVAFQDSGYYSLYVHLRVGGGEWDDDSFFYARGFGEKDDTTSTDWVLVNGLASAGFTDSANIVYDVGTAGSGVWKWVNVTKNTYSGALGDSFYVSQDSLTQIFQIGSREDGLDIDKIVFGKSNLYFSVANLDSGEAGSAVLPGSENAWNGPPLAVNQPKFVGNIHSGAQINNFESYWNAVIPENAGKWGSVEGTRDNMNWGGLDAAYSLAKDNDFPFNFHVLLWGAQQPSWINDLTQEEQLAEIREWFEAVAERYPDIDYLQVVNEPLIGHNPPDGNNGRANYKAALGGDGDSGYDWVITAFRMAREVFPDTKLMINDFNIINNNNSTNTYVKIINLLKAENLIDVIGVQGHAFTTTAPTATLRGNLNKLGATGLPIQVTELDIDGPTDDIQLNEYKRIFPALYEHPKVEGIVLWGWRPGLWRNDEAAYIINQDGTERPALIWLRNYLDSLNVDPVSVEDLTELP